MRRPPALTVRAAGLSALPAAARRPRLIREAVLRAFRLGGGARARGEVSVVVLPGKRMRAMNRQFLGHDWDTDVLSFRHDPAPGPARGQAPLGDVYLSARMARRQARELGHSVLRETLVLAAHGALHLLGHDDADAPGKRRMERLQERAVAGLGG